MKPAKNAFVPLFKNPHLQMIAGNFWRRPQSERSHPPQRRLFRTEPDVQVLVETQTPTTRKRGDIVMVHGLEGSGGAGYMQSLSAAALRFGFAAHRFHMRTCGGTEQLCPTLYHAGLTSDLLSVLTQLQESAGSSQASARSTFLVGFSLGGNVVLKLAGELGNSAPQRIAGVCAVSAPLDLAACARRLAEFENRIYEQRFVRHMRARLAASGRFKAIDASRLRSVMEIDDRITAPSFGFGNAENYYRTQSAIRFLDAMRVPALLIQAKDDTFIPFEIFETEAVRSNPYIELLATERGGHLGFIGRAPRRFWVDDAVMEWIDARMHGRRV